MIAAVDLEAVLLIFVLDAQKSPLHDVLSDPQCIIIAIRISEDYSGCVSLEY